MIDPVTLMLEKLIAAGTPAALVAEVAIALARAEATANAKIEAAAQPKAGALRMRRYRDRQASQSVTCDDGDARVTESVTDPAPSPPPPLSPHTPQTPPPPHPHPEGFDAYAYESARLAISVIVVGCSVLIEAKRARRGGWPADMPPPVDVTDQQWSGFISHRRSKREPMTARAYELLVAKLAGHSCEVWPPGRIIDTIIDRGWLSFERSWLERIEAPRNARPAPADNRGRRGSRPDPALDLYHAAVAAEEAERASSSWPDSERAWLSLPPVGTG